MRRRCGRGIARTLADIAVAVAASLLLIGPAAAAAPAQTPAPPPAPAVDFNLDAEPVTKPPQDETPAAAVPEPTDVLEAGTPTTTTPAPAAEQDANIRSGAGSAQAQPLALKQKEATEKCYHKTQISSLLGLPGSSGSDSGGSWGLLLLAVALGSGAVAVFIWLRRRRRGTSDPRDPLETVSAIVALISTIVGLALSLVPGVGVDQPPPPDATMHVREAHARITHGEYAKKTGTSAGRDKVDKREVGNVIWLELQLDGYANTPLRLQYGSYRYGGGGGLLPGTAREINLGRKRNDVETTFLPVWIGYPRRADGLRRFQAQFRLIDERRRILNMAHTGRMKTWQYRYAC